MTLTLGTLPNEKEASTSQEQNQREVPDGELQPKLGLTPAPSGKAFACRAQAAPLVSGVGIG
jgi:hypothetical protein